MSRSRPSMSTLDIKAALEKNKKEDEELERLSKTIEYKNVELAHSEIKSEQIPSTHFTYERILKEGIIKKGLYKAGLHLDDGYIALALRSLRKGEKPVCDYGLKIHISLDDTIQGNIARGWNAIVGILKYYHVARTKVVSDRIRKDDPTEDSLRCGKQITIYACVHNKESNWQNVLSAITEVLLKNNIAPGYRPNPDGSRAVKNNCYLSYRYDLDIDSIKPAYRPTSTLGAFPQGVEDPLNNLNIPTLEVTPKPSPPLRTLNTESSLFQQDTNTNTAVSSTDDPRNSSTSNTRRRSHS